MILRFCVPAHWRSMLRRGTLAKQLTPLAPYCRRMAAVFDREGLDA